MKSKSLLKRSDDGLRTEDELFENIFLNEEKEEIYAQALKIQRSFESLKRYTAVKPGVKYLNGLPDDKPDYIALWGGTPFIFEQKTGPENLRKFSTFKVHSLESCIKWHGKLIYSRQVNFVIFNKIGISHLLKLDREIHPKFSPNDIAVRLSANRMSIYIDKKWARVFNWTSLAREYLNSNKEILDRKINDRNG